MSFRELRFGSRTEPVRADGYHAFMSYARADTALVDALQHGIEQLAKPLTGRRTVELYLDRRSLNTGGELEQRLIDALDRSEFLIVVASRHSATSPWVGKEIEHWLRTRSTDHIILAIADGQPEWSAEDECWTDESRALLPAPLHDAFTAEPLYLDLTDEAAAARHSPKERPDRLTLDNADFKVKIAAIQGRLRGMEPADIVSEDLDLWRRAERRRRRVRLGLVSLTVLSLLAGAAAMWFAAESAQRETEARSGQLASQSDLDRVDLGMLLGVEAYRVDQSAESFGALITGAGKAADLEILLHEHSRPVRSVAFDPDGEILASTGLDGTVVLRSTEAWTPTGPPLVPGGASVDADDLAPLRGLDLDRFGRLAAASRSGTVHLWDISEPSAPEELPPIVIDRGSPVLAVAFDRVGSTLLAGGEAPGAGSACDGDGGADVSVVSLDSDLRRSLGHDGAECALAIEVADDGTVAIGLSNGEIALWRLGDDARGDVRVGTIEAHDGWVTSLDFAPDGRLVSAGADNTAAVWDFTEAEDRDATMVAQELLRFRGHTDVVRTVRFSPDGDFVASAGRDDDIILWNPEDGTTGRPFSSSHAAEVRELAFHPSRPLLASASSDSTVGVWRTDGGRTFATSLHGGSVWAIGLLAEREVLLTAGASVAERSSDGESVNGVRWTQLGSSANPNWSVTPQPVFALATSADERLAASGEADGTIRVWDTETHEEIAAHSMDDAIVDLAFMPDSRGLYVAEQGGRITALDDALDPSAVRTTVDVPSTGFVTALSGDGSWLAAADEGTGVILVDTRIGAVRSIDVSSEPVRSLAFADDGSVLAIGDNAGDIAVVDVASGEQRGSTLVGHTGSVEAISFHPDGVVLASGSSDRTVRLWNTSTQVAIVESLRRHTGSVSGLVWTDRGRVLASSADGEALVWDLRPVSLRGVICRVANRNLTRDEWSTFVGGTYRRRVRRTMPTTSEPVLDPGVRAPPTERNRWSGTCTKLTTAWGVNRGHWRRSSGRSMPMTTPCSTQRSMRSSATAEHSTRTMSNGCAAS